MHRALESSDSDESDDSMDTVPVPRLSADAYVKHDVSADDYAQRARLLAEVGIPQEPSRVRCTNLEHV